jgi:hypothetical protein
MNGRGLATRLARLERQMVPLQRPRIVVRFEGPRSEKLLQPNEEDLDENTRVITVRFVESDGNGRPRREGAEDSRHERRPA